MGQYKVPQNVEAEDKILGPLTFKQFIYALIGIGWGAICYFLLLPIPVVMVILGLPPALLFLLLAFYTRDGQDFEHILIAMVTYFSSPHQRYWYKDDVAESFHLQPRQVTGEQTQRNPAQVRSELEKLGNLIDSRGWNLSAQPSEPTPVTPVVTPDQRPVTPSPPAAPSSDEPKADMLDLTNSPLAQNLTKLLEEAAQDVRAEAIQQMSNHTIEPTAQPSPSRVEPPVPTGPPILAAPAPQSAPEVTEPRQTKPQPVLQGQPNPPITSNVTSQAPTDILKLATQNDDLTISRIAAAANRQTDSPEPLVEGQTVELHTDGSNRQSYQ